ncbi:MAG: methyltransferase domain-containing protein [Candidatus Omnitrophica bacterium]|nr:methyltransferase domain-containing protein [Candidatus Omnitrophota bacterium]
MGYIDFISNLHTKTKRDYLERVIKYDKAECAQVAKRLDKDYWDGDRKYGYGGYSYDGRWKSMAERLVEYYGLKPGQRVLDIGCGKGFLLYELKLIIPELEIRGLDISSYALEHAKEEVKPFLDFGSACKLAYAQGYFDLVISLNTLHYLYIFELEEALREIERVKRGSSYIVVESYRSEKEKNNLLCWQLTCECFYTPQEWIWIFGKSGYKGDYSFIFFE